MIVSIKNLSKKFGEKYIFQNFDLAIKENEITSIYGESGTGKSTLLNIIGLIEEYDDGVVTIFDKKAPKLNSKEAMLLKRKSISYLFQNFALIEDKSIHHNLDIALEYQTLTKNEKIKAKIALLEKVGIEQDPNQKIYTLSGGEKQRIALARCLLKPSKLILADEPTGSLDDKNAEIILNLLKEEQLQHGKTIVIVTHDPKVINYSNNIISL